MKSGVSEDRRLVFWVMRMNPVFTVLVNRFIAPGEEYLYECEAKRFLCGFDYVEAIRLGPYQFKVRGYRSEQRDRHE